MTRITNFGRKRTYVEAGFNSEPSQVTITGEVEVTTEKPKTAINMREGEYANRNSIDRGGHGMLKVKTSKAASWRAEQSEFRRKRRIAQRQADTICFACREKGHSAKECPIYRLDNGPDSEAERNMISSVGLCYRCGSKLHTLSRCKKPINPLDPLPFGSCFVCSAKGHLASSCPKNTAKGIYPNGGSCKLCGDAMHLAKNCGLRKNDTSNNDVMGLAPGTGSYVGADEDDFHAFKRQTAQIDRDEKKVERFLRSMPASSAVHSGVGKPPGKQTIAPANKVVYF